MTWLLEHRNSVLILDHSSENLAGAKDALSGHATALPLRTPTSRPRMPEPMRAARSAVESGVSLLSGVESEDAADRSGPKPGLQRTEMKPGSGCWMLAAPAPAEL
jgi:hypothetical protein